MVCLLWLLPLGGFDVSYATASNALIFTSSNGTSISSVMDTTSLTISSSSSIEDSQSNTTFVPGHPITLAVHVADISNPTTSLIGIVSWNDNRAGGIFNPDNCLLINNKCAITYTPPNNLSSVTITATYGGDSSHSGIYDTTILSAITPSTKSSTVQSMPTNSMLNNTVSTSSFPPSQSPPSQPSAMKSTVQASPPKSVQVNTTSPTPTQSITLQANLSKSTQTTSTSTSSSPTTTSPATINHIATTPHNTSASPTVSTVNQVVNAPETIFDKIIAIITSILKKI